MHYQGVTRAQVSVLVQLQSRSEYRLIYVRQYYSIGIFFSKYKALSCINGKSSVLIGQETMGKYRIQTYSFEYEIFSYPEVEQK